MNRIQPLLISLLIAIASLASAPALSAACPNILVSPVSLPNGSSGTPYVGNSVTQTGGTSVAFSITSGALPTGLSMNTAGNITGTPTTSGTFVFIATATDSAAGAVGCTGGRTYAITITCGTITVSNPGTSSGTVDAPFSQTFPQSGASGTATFTLNSGSLPAGLLLSTAGVLSGTPSAPGSFPITVKVTDSNGCTGISGTYTLVVSCQAITVSNPGVTTGTVDAAFSRTFTQAGVGTHTPASFTLNSGTLPSGLVLSAAGLLSGTPGQPGSFPITVKVTDANGCFGISATYPLVIGCQTITVTAPAVTTGIISTAFSQSFTQVGVGTHTPASFTTASTLPAGITLASSGLLAGTPTQTGTFPIVVTVTDANGCTGTSATYTLAIAPKANNDAYVNLVDNTQAVVTGGTTGSPATPFVSLAGTLIANDAPVGFVTATAGTSATSAGGSVTIAADGTFVYTPKANPNAAAITADSFTYTVSSNTGGVSPVTSAAGTVNLTLANRVWYVKNNAAGGGNGQSQSPFNTLATAGGTASTANDIIFVYNGDGTNNLQNAGIALKNGQQLFGEINGLTVNAQALVPAGSRPVIGNSGGAGVTVLANTANGDRTGVFIKGLTVAGSANAIDISSLNAQTLNTTVDNVVISAATNNGIRISGGSSLTSTVTIQNSTVTAAVQNGIDAQQTVAGNLVLNFNNNLVTATGTGINVNGAGSTSTTITNFATNTISGITGGNGITVTSATFDATPGAPFNVVSGGNTSIGASGNGVGAAGMIFTNVSGDLSFTDLDIFADNGPGLKANGLAVYNGSVGFQIGVGAGVASSTAINGPAVDLTTVSATLPFNLISTSNSSTTGVNLDTVMGTFAAPGGSSISNSTGTDFNINAGNATVTYGGTITDTSGRVVSITNTTGGVKSFSGAITNNGGTGISLTSNTGATIGFSGTIALTTGASDAFTATGGGTVTATDTASAVSTTTGTAINVANTTIGATNLVFRSVSAGTAASGPANGIIMNNTGASGGLTILGTGGAGTGGTIQKTSSNSILLTSARSVSLSSMNVQNSLGSGILGTTVTDLSLASCSFTNNGSTSADVGVKVNNLAGNATFTNTNITGSALANIFVDNTSGTLSSFTISGGNYSNLGTAFGGNSVLLDIRGTSTLTTGNITGATFSNNKPARGVTVQSQDTATISSFTVQSSTFTNNGLQASFEQSGSANLTFKLINNPTMTMTLPAAGTSHAVNVASSSTSTGGTIQGRIQGNVIGNAATASSGSPFGNGIRVLIQGRTQATLLIDGNTIRQIPQARGIDAQFLGPLIVGALVQSDITVTNNDVNPQDSTGFPLAAIYLGADSQAGSPTRMRSDVRGNTVPAGAASDSLPTFLIVDKVVAAAEAQLVDTPPASANCTAQLTSTNTGSSSASGGCTLIAGPISTPP